MRINRYTTISIVAAAVVVLTSCSATPAPPATSASPSASASAAADARTIVSTLPGNGTLELGYVLPETGSLSGLGVGIIAAVKLALSDINKAGGVNGAQVTLTGGDEAGDPTIAGQTVDRLLGQGVDAIVGPVSSAISLSVIDKITGSGVLQCAGANTSKTFTDYDSHGLYFRTIPPNIKQGPVLAQAVIGEGASRVAVLVRNDDYGKSLSSSLIENLKSSGAEIVAEVPYDPAATTYTAEVSKVKAASPDAVVVIAFQEGTAIIRSLIETGMGPDKVKLFGTDGMSLGTLASTVDKASPGVLEGMQATQASSQNDPEFIKRLVAANPGLAVTNFSPYHYDCVISIALAAVAAKSDAPGKIAQSMYTISNAPGDECSDFAKCLALLKSGKDINYQGVSGPLDLNPAGEPSVGLFDIVKFNNAGVPQIIKTIKSKG
jgi:ABC-type branched-chain amino acid transport systems, periplasmic component